MRLIARCAAAIVVVIAMTMPSVAGDGSRNGAPCACNAVASLMMGIRSDNQGLRESAAFVLGEIKCTEAVIPLMRMLHEEKSESARIAAALALSLIGDPRGVYAVKRAVVFDESSRVRILSAYFYNEYVHPQTFAFVPTAPETSPHYASN